MLLVSHLPPRPQPPSDCGCCRSLQTPWTHGRLGARRPTAGRRQAPCTRPERPTSARSQAPPARRALLVSVSSQPAGTRRLPTPTRRLRAALGRAGRRAAAAAAGAARGSSAAAEAGAEAAAATEAGAGSARRRRRLARQTAWGRWTCGSCAAKIGARPRGTLVRDGVRAPGHGHTAYDDAAPQPGACSSRAAHFGQHCHDKPLMHASPALLQCRDSPPRPPSTLQRLPQTSERQASGGVAKRSPSFGAVPGAPLNDNRYLMSQGRDPGTSSMRCSWAGHPHLAAASFRVICLVQTSVSKHDVCSTNAQRPEALSQAPLQRRARRHPPTRPADSGAFIDAVAHTPTKDPLDAKSAAARLTPSNFAPGE